MQLSVVNIKQCAPETLFIQCERPTDYLFTAGQYAYVGVTKKKYPDYDHHIRLLSFASAPHEPTLDFLVRLRDSGYKKELSELSVGHTLDVSLPIGNFSWNSDAKAVVAIAGGVGIAPFISLLKNSVQKPPLTLIWSNHTPETAPLLKEVQNLEKTNSSFSLISLYTRNNPNERITETWLKNRQMIDPLYYYMLSGPPGLVEEVSELLTRNNVPLNHIIQEAFTGYE